MSKVYSFRLDENNPREAQAMRVIDAWVEDGYSLRHQQVYLLISSNCEIGRNDDYSKLLKQIKRIVGDSKQEKEISENSNTILSDNFVSSLKTSVKDGIIIEEATLP